MNQPGTMFRPLSDGDLKRISGRIDKATTLLSVADTAGIKRDAMEVMWIERYQEEAWLLLEHHGRVQELEEAVRFAKDDLERERHRSATLEARNRDLAFRLADLDDARGVS